MRRFFWSRASIGVLLSLVVTSAAFGLAGDVNEDTALNAVDIQLVINAALGGAFSTGCDINKDSAINAVDVQLVINATLGKDISGQILGSIEGEGEGEGQLPPTEGEGEGEGQLPPTEGEGEGEGQLPPTEGEGEGEGQLPPTEGEGEGEGQLPPTEGEGEGEGQLPPTEGEGEGESSSLPLALVAVPGGAFPMGEPVSDVGLDGLSLHTVTLSPYTVGKYEVTNQQYAEVLNWAVQQGRLTTASEGEISVYGHELLDIDSEYCKISWDGEQFTVDTWDTVSMEDHPVVEASWYGAVAFCNWLSEMEGRSPCYDLQSWTLTAMRSGGYRLPTEAEWECAAAWDATLDKKWRYAISSDTLATDQCTYNSSNPLGLTNPPYTSPVGYYTEAMSPAGCCDMSGNVWEWCQDWFDEDYYEHSAATDPTGPATGSWRVFRGGSWRFIESGSRTTYRIWAQPSATSSTIGFRVVR